MKSFLNGWKRFFILIISSLFLYSCFVDNDEIMTLPPRQPGDPQIFLLENSVYSYQSYFNLETNEVTASNEKTSWDLAFECSDTANHILINPATKARLIKLNKTFEEVTSLTGIAPESWAWDNSDGELSKTAVGNWLDFSKVPPKAIENTFVLDKGYDESGNRLGYKKFELIGFENNSYKIRFADLNGNNEYTANIPKENNVNFIAFSFNNGGEILNLEPDNNNWQILFSQYTGKTPDDYGHMVDYFVQGVLLNRDGIQAVVDTIHSFAEIDYELAQTFNYSSKMDTIGHMWKTVSINMETYESTYICDTNRIQIIKTPNNIYYKLRFLDYYNRDGQKGYPSFEYQKL
ncbi:MAG: hypothetical protein GXO79_08865 [Chlorobi bacterium]|nr:hypothetical protein [Chlorobiota bacterium]